MLTKPGPFSRSTQEAQWRNWLIGHALPLWDEAGFDPHRQLYHERLTWGAAPIAMEQLRLMVQARQVATYCRAALDGLYDRSAQAIRCLDEVERRYRRADGAPGWVFAIAHNGQPASPVRDLYAHAFILFAYAWAYKVTGENRYLVIARETTTEISQIFAARHGGFMDTVPMSGVIRRQNPHMHLLEAYLALFETTGDAFYLDQAKPLVMLGLDRFIDIRSGMLLEFFRPDWRPCRSWGLNRAEPGHIFEWSWLLGEYQRLSGCDGMEKARIITVAERLFAVGITAGCDPVTGFAYDAMTEKKEIIEHATRIWPQTELMRLLRLRRDRGEDRATKMLARLSSGFFERYAPQHLAGGWIDRLDPQLQPLVDYMPASSLYHIYGAGRELVLPQDQLVQN